MPHVHNGIGTWYAGKRNVVNRKGSCTLCNAYGDLRSYDTTLYFVFLMIPLIPLKKVHVIDDCSACRRHRTVKQKEWDRLKGEGIKKALDEVQSQPGDRDTALRAIGTAVGLQDNEAFLGLSALIEETSAQDPVVLAALAEGYTYFNHTPAAEAALRKALSLKPPTADDERIREQLGVHLLMHGDPDEGAALVSHILDNRDPKKAQTVLLAVEAYRAAGRHTEALSLLDRLESTFPGMSNDKRVKQLRKSSTKLASSGRPVKIAYIHPNSPKARAEHTWMATLPRLIGPALAAIGLVWYVAAAWWIGENRLIHVVSGSMNASTVEIAGRRITIPPLGHATTRIPEGVAVVRVTSPGTHVPETSCRIATNFWTRPFSSPVIVVDPDHLALIAWEETEYLPKNSPRVGRSNHAIYIGELLHTFTDIDYPFEDFPAEVNLSKSSTGELRHRVDLIPIGDIADRLHLVAATNGGGSLNAYAIRGVQADPGVSEYSDILSVPEDKAGSIAALKPLLADRPVHIPIHRAYQELVRDDHPEALLSEYRDLQNKAPSDNALKYLLARLEETDREKANRLWRESMADPDAGGYSVGALAYDLLAAARFEEALAMLDKAPSGNVNAARLEDLRCIALHGLGRFEDILKLPSFAMPQEDMSLAQVQGLLYYKQRAVTAASGREEGRKAAQAIIDELCAPYLSRPEKADTVKTMRDLYGALIAYVDGEEGPEAALAGGPNGGFVSNLSKGDLAAAEKYLDETRALGDASGPLLLAIAATLKADDTFAREQFDHAAAAFDKARYGNRVCADWFRGKATPAPGEALALSMDAREKAITLIALGLKFPERRIGCFTLARKLNFDRRSPYLLLDRALRSAPNP